ncbi:hypothetical protein [Demequina litorisediminis]|uniref:hypothetical protein n=1 Tax=Demequina litorisediminis TaxID=1849022 RepID=UPI0024E18827|nr:hypothetical protein [Demequina litorisediminis]
MADVGLDPVQWLRNAEAELASDPTLDLTALARRTGTTEDQARTLLGARLVGLLLLPTAQRRTDLSPRASRRLLSALHAAAHATPRALTEATYSAFVTKSRENLPSSSEIVRTFGSLGQRPRGGGNPQRLVRDPPRWRMVGGRHRARRRTVRR